MSVWFLSAMAEKQKMWLACGGAGIGVWAGLVLWIPCLFILSRPFVVAGDGLRCFLTLSAVMCGNPFSWPLLIAFINVCVGGQNNV